MRVDFQASNFDRYNYPQNSSRLGFTGGAKSKLFDPFLQKYDRTTEFLAEKYYAAFYKSKFAGWFIDKTRNVKNMTTHMSALGATLISGVYTFRTLTNDKLDSERRKTLALNDVMVWALSTTGSYLIDSKLANWWEGVTTRFAANYLQQHPQVKKVRTFGDWNPADIYEMIGDKFTISAKDKDVDKLIKEAESKGYTCQINGKKITFSKAGKYAEMINNRIDRINKAVADPQYTGKIKTIENKIEPGVKNIRDFNLDILKNKKLTTLIDGMGVLKSLFVFGMVYRYIVPVLVMKPANKIGAYIHKRKDEKAEDTEPKKS